MIELLFTSGITYNDWVNGTTVETECECGGLIITQAKGLDNINIGLYDHAAECDKDDLIEYTKDIVKFQRTQFFKLLKCLYISPMQDALKKSARSVAAKFLCAYDKSYISIPGHGLAELAAIDLHNAKMLASIASETVETPAPVAYLLAD